MQEHLRYDYTGPTCGDIKSDTCPGKLDGSSFTGAFCTNGGSGSINGQYSDNTPDVEVCATQCRQYAAFYHSRSEDSCYCVNNVVKPTRIDCSSSFWAAYYHDAPATASGLARRQLARERRLSERDTSLCPAGLTACRIDGSADGYESLDTMTELESCGGCRHGIFTATIASAAFPVGQQRLGRVDRRGRSALTLRADASGPVGVDCSDRKTFGPGLTCRQGNFVAH